MIQLKTQKELEEHIKDLEHESAVYEAMYWMPVAEYKYKYGKDQHIRINFVRKIFVLEIFVHINVHHIFAV